jgi:hypothetical protein
MSAAVNLSMIIMGPPHWGQEELGVMSWAAECRCFGLRWFEVECCKAQWQKLSSVAAREEAEVADAHETFWEQMQQEAA